MINKLISAICTALFTEFGEHYEIYKESIEQGLQEPCFFVQSITPLKTDEVGTRKKRDYTFMIQYFPSTNNVYAEINDVIDRLEDTLSHVTVDGVVIRGVDVSPTTVDKVLNYQVTYQFFTISENTVDSIGEYQLSNNVKG